MPTLTSTAADVDLTMTLMLMLILTLKLTPHPELEADGQITLALHLMDAKTNMLAIASPKGTLLIFRGGWGYVFCDFRSAGYGF